MIIKRQSDPIYSTIERLKDKWLAESTLAFEKILKLQADSRSLIKVLPEPLALTKKANESALSFLLAGNDSSLRFLALSKTINSHRKPYRIFQKTSEEVLSASGLYISGHSKKATFSYDLKIDSRDEYSELFEKFEKKPLFISDGNPNETQDQEINVETKGKGETWEGTHCFGIEDFVTTKNEENKRKQKIIISSSDGILTIWN